MMNIDEPLAKSDGTTLRQHTIDVVNAAKELFHKLPFNEEEKAYWRVKITRAAILHDLGKIHPDFQNNLKENSEKRIPIRHEIISLWLIENLLSGIPQEEKFAVATHHKGIISNEQKGRLEFKTLKEHLKDQINRLPEIGDLSKFLNDWAEEFQLSELKFATHLNVEEGAELSKEVISLLRDKKQKKLPDSERIHLAETRGLLIAADHIASSGFQGQIPAFKQLLIENFKPYNDNDGQFFPFRHFQEEMLNVQNDAILHAPTGSGKTEAALAWFYANQQENARLFYLLPYTASINAMVKRLQGVFGKDKVTALHSKTLDLFFDQLEEEASNNDDPSDFYQEIQEEAVTKASLSKEMYFPIKVATPHQILRYSLLGKGWEMGLHDFRNACFIIDEFHTYNALLTGITFSTLNWLKENFNAKFLFMSATIPEFLSDEIKNKLLEGSPKKVYRPNGEFPSDAEILNKTRHYLKCYEAETIYDQKEMIENYLKVKEPSKVLVIVNNVQSAQTLFKEIQVDENQNKLLLHGGFNQRSRKSIENQITSDDEKEVPDLLIATQAVEVSLDIDYDVGFVENAPIDSLIQRLGRINRAGKREPVPIHLFENSMGQVNKIYDKEVLQKSWSELLKFDNELLTEEDLVKICNIVYKDGYNESQFEDFKKGWNNPTITNFSKRVIAGDWRPWIEEVLEDSNAKVDVICGNLEEEYDELKSEGRFIEANRLFVSVYPTFLYNNTIDKIKTNQKPIAYELEYDEDLGYKISDKEIEDRLL